MTQRQKKLDYFVSSPDIMTKDEAKKLIRELAQFKCIGLPLHCRKQMQKRSVTTDDLLFVMFWGDIISVEKGNAKHNWKCTIKGKDIDGDEITLIAAINEKEQSVFCVTVF